MDSVINHFKVFDVWYHCVVVGRFLVLLVFYWWHQLSVAVESSYLFIVVLNSLIPAEWMPFGPIPSKTFWFWKFWFYSIFLFSGPYADFEVVCSQNWIQMWKRSIWVEILWFIVCLHFISKLQMYLPLSSPKHWIVLFVFSCHLFTERILHSESHTICFLFIRFNLFNKNW